MGEPLKLVSADESAKARLIAVLEENLANVRSGKTRNLLIISESGEAYSFSRTNMSLEIGLAFLTRVSYRLQQEWDEAL